MHFLLCELTSMATTISVELIGLGTSSPGKAQGLAPHTCIPTHAHMCAHANGQPSQFQRPGSDICTKWNDLRGAENDKFCLHQDGSRECPGEPGVPPAPPLIINNSHLPLPGAPCHQAPQGGCLGHSLKSSSKEHRHTARSQGRKHKRSKDPPEPGSYHNPWGQKEHQPLPHSLTPACTRGRPGVPTIVLSQ